MTAGQHRNHRFEIRIPSACWFGGLSPCARFSREPLVLDFSAILMVSLALDDVDEKPTLLRPRRPTRVSYTPDYHWIAPSVSNSSAAKPFQAPGSQLSCMGPWNAKLAPAPAFLPGYTSIGCTGKRTHRSLSCDQLGRAESTTCRWNRHKLRHAYPLIPRATTGPC